MELFLLLSCYPLFCMVVNMSLILKAEFRLRVFEIRVLRKVFWYKKDDVTGDWRGLHNDLLNIIRIIKSSKI